MVELLHVRTKNYNWISQSSNRVVTMASGKKISHQTLHNRYGETEHTVPSFVLNLLTSVSLTVNITSPASTCGKRRQRLSIVLYVNLKCISRLLYSIPPTELCFQ